MPKPKSGTSYRLSQDAQHLLTSLAGKLGLTKTGVLEMAIRKLAYAELDGAEWRRDPQVPLEAPQSSAVVARQYGS
jgi:hypothetical protein